MGQTANQINSKTDRLLPISGLQQIQFESFMALANGDITDPPENRHPDVVKAFLARFGPLALMMDHEALNQLFAGVTMDIYRQIVGLYLSNPQRSWRQIAAILERASTRANARPINPEAVWLLTAYLHPLQQSIRQIRLYYEGHWAMATIQLPVSDTAVGLFVSYIGHYVETKLVRIEALSITSDPPDPNQSSLLLYEALVASRLPALKGEHLPRWRLPAELSINAPSAEIQTFCGLMDISLKENRGVSYKSLEQIVSPEALSDAAGRGSSIVNKQLLVDRAIEIVLGSSPTAQAESNLLSFGQTTTYWGEPLEQLPELLELLPHQTITVDPTGTVALFGKHYQSEILSLWPAESVTCRRLPSFESRIWVYNSLGYLDQAWAQELRRPDGSYRQFL